MMRLTESPVRHFFVISWYGNADEYHLSADDHILTQQVLTVKVLNEHNSSNYVGGGLVRALQRKRVSA